MGGGLVTVLIATAHGLGHHAFTLSKEDQIVYGKTVFAQALLTTVTSLCLLKLSVAVSLLRLSGPAAGINRYYRRIIWALIGTRWVCYLGGPDKTPEPRSRWGRVRCFGVFVRTTCLPEIC